MDDPIVKLAMEERAALLSRLTFLNKIIAMAGGDDASPSEAGTLDLGAAQRVHSERVRSRQRTRAANPPTEDVYNAIERILRANRRPMTRGELHKALALEGLVIEATGDPRKVLGTMIWRVPHRFVPTGEGYWLAGEPIPVLSVPPSVVSSSDE